MITVVRVDKRNDRAGINECASHGPGWIWSLTHAAITRLRIDPENLLRFRS